MTWMAWIELNWFEWLGGNAPLDGNACCVSLQTGACSCFYYRRACLFLCVNLDEHIFCKSFRPGMPVIVHRFRRACLLCSSSDGRACWHASQSYGQVICWILKGQYILRHTIWILLNKEVFMSVIRVQLSS